MTSFQSYAYFGEQDCFKIWFACNHKDIAMLCYLQYLYLRKKPRQERLLKFIDMKPGIMTNKSLFQKDLAETHIYLQCVKNMYKNILQIWSIYKEPLYTSLHWVSFCLIWPKKNDMSSIFKLIIQSLSGSSGRQMEVGNWRSSQKNILHEKPQNINTNT